MPFILRTIRKSRWYDYRSIPWLAESELPADVFLDLQTASNSLSVWYIEDHEANFGRVITALAANRNNFAHVDYAIFDFKHISNLNIKIDESVKGITPDEEANFWHLDLVELTATQLLELAKVIMTKAKRQRVSQKDVKKSIIQAVISEQLDLTRIEPQFQEKIRALLP